MERYSPIETFGFEMAVLGSKIRSPTLNKLAVTDFQCILTPLFITVEIFDIVIPYLYAV